MRRLVVLFALAGCTPLDGEEFLMAQIQARRDSPPPLADVRLTPPGFAGTSALPKSIKVWRRGLDGSSASCSGRVDTIDFEDYVKGVLPHEWITSWDEESLKAGAVAIRTYAWYWVNAGGKYDCADIDDTTASQVYKDARVAKASQAVDDTRGQTVVTSTGAPVFAEYSAENSDPTKDGVSEPHCTGKALYGHGRGMCQWGTQRWALAGKDYQFMVAHYYPGRTLTGVGPAWGAKRAGTQAPPAEMTSGEEAVVWLEFVNEGSSGWTIAETRVGTTSPRDRKSAFFAPQNWLSDSRPTGADHAYASGQTGRFSFVMRAPEVDKDTVFTEHFGLVQEGVSWFGPEVTFDVMVHPKSSAPAGDPNLDPVGDTDPAKTQMGTSTTAGGCSVAPRGQLAPWMLLFGVLLWRRRREAR
jgi:hypothetical protein